MTEGPHDKIWHMIRKVGVAMLTSDDDGVLRSRPMAASQKGFDGVLWFFTREHAAKVAEVRQDPLVCVSYADPGSQTYVSLSGRASLVTDPPVLADHWHESLRTWFPKGLQDKELALLKVDVDQGEYWDAPSSTMIHAYGYVKARLTGEPPHPGGHDKVRL
jgi:general stress protein 26